MSAKKSLNLEKALADLENLVKELERSDEVKTSAVHFLSFELPRDQVVALKADAALAAGIDHENYLVEVSPVAENTRGALLADLD